MNRYPELRESIDRINRHPPYQGSEQIVLDAMQDLREHYQRFLINPIQYSELYRLLSASPHLRV